MPGADDTPRTPDPGGTHAASNGEPRFVAGYRLLRRVGEGGMSTVYLSYDVPGRRAVAVKLLADHLSGQREFVTRFYREARFSRFLHHPNIVRGFAAGYDPEAGKHYLVLEFIDGPSTHTAMTRLTRLPVGLAVRVGIDVARALDFLHRRNYVHRDVKPDNILLPAGGTAKLADLGLTKRLSDDSHLTAVNQGVGTSYYMPYEQAMNAALVDGRSDIFALGATLYHLLTGQVPFPGSTHEEVMRGKEHDAFTPPRELNPDVPAELDRIIAATLVRDPRGRFQEASELADALDAIGLATPIPAFDANDDSGRAATDEHRPVDTPTRADLPLRPGLLEPGAGFVPPGNATPLPGSDEPPGGMVSLDGPKPRGRLLPITVTGLALMVGVGGTLHRFAPAAPTPAPRDALVHERPTAPPAGLPPTDPQ